MRGLLEGLGQSQGLVGLLSLLHQGHVCLCVGVHMYVLGGRGPSLELTSRLPWGRVSVPTAWQSGLPAHCSSLGIEQSPSFSSAGLDLATLWGCYKEDLCTGRQLDGWVT